MRITAGSAKGTVLQGPKFGGTRPTTDKVRMAVCNALQSRGALEGARVLDLFAGTGAFGIEAKSRGAKVVTFVESQPKALRLIRENLARAGFSDDTEIEVIGGKLPEVLRSLFPHDVAFADPPYEFAEWTALLDLVPAALVVAEARQEVAAPVGWDSMRSTRYGDTTVTFLQRWSQ